MVVELFKSFFLRSTIFLTLCELLFFLFLQVLCWIQFFLSLIIDFFLLFLFAYHFHCNFFLVCNTFLFALLFLCANFKNGLCWCSIFLSTKRCCLRFYFQNHFYFFLQYRVNFFLFFFIFFLFHFFLVFQCSIVMMS